MGLRNIRHFYLIFFVFVFTGFFGQKLYWVGGSGNFNDPQHWSLTSGGPACNQIPSQSTDVIIDDKSGVFVTEIRVPDLPVSIKSFASVNFKEFVSIIGGKSSSLNVKGSLLLFSKTKFDYEGEIIFNNNPFSVNNIDFGLNVLKCDLTFKEGTYNIRSISQVAGKTLSFENGTYNLKRSSITSNELIIKGNSTYFNVDTSLFNIQSKINISGNPNFKTHLFSFYGPFNSPSDISIATGTDFGNTTKLINNKNSAICQATITTVPECSGPCTGFFRLVIDPTCANPPYNLIVSNATGSCVGTSNNISNSATPLTYTVGGNCYCSGTAYNAVLIDNLINIIPIYQGGVLNSNFNFQPPSYNLTTISSLAPSCNSSCDGTLTLVATGGTGPYTITVSPPVSPPITTAAGFTLGSLCGGLYTFTITDANGCSGIVTKSVTAPAPISPALVTASINCFGQCTGSAQVTPSGGNAGGYTVTWTPPGTTVAIGAGGTSSVTSLCAGNYTVRVADTKACFTQSVFTISQPATSITATTSQTNVTCGTLCNASASVSASGGSPGYTYNWTPAPGGGQGTSLATGLCGSLTPAPANYTVTVTDIKGCVITRTFAIVRPPTLTVTPTSTNATCNGTCNGTANANPSGGVPPYVISWTGPGAFSSSSPNITNLCAGVYTLSVTDASLCTLPAPVTVTITQPPAISLTVNSTSIMCFGTCVGSATATAGGGPGPITYTWLPVAPPITGQGTPTVSNLCAGNYSVTISSGVCTYTPVPFTILAPVAINQNVTTTSLTCNSACTGVINSVPSGGSGGPYTFTLASASSTVTTNPPYNSLCAGVYTLSVRDAGGCVRTQTYNIAQPNALTVSATTTSLSCFGNCNASLSGSAGGGTPAYTYTWTTPTTTIASAVIVNQCAGTYTLNIRDANGCTTSTVVTITQPTDVTVALTPTTPNCNNGCNGSITSTVSGGTPAYTYNWSTGSTLTSVSGLCPGNYTLTVTDSKGCPKTSTITITNPPPIAISTTAVPVSCVGSCNGQAFGSASGGTPGYNYSWNTIPVTTGTVAGGLCSGNYVLTVTDSKGCITSTNVAISAPVPLTAAITGVIPSCNACTGAATVTAGGGTPAYTYSWLPSSQTNSVANSLCAGVQTVIVTDSKGCTVTRTVNIIMTVSVNITTTGTVLACNSACTGAANANTTGGTSPYSFTWTPTAPTQTTQIATGLCAGVYTVLAMDKLGCSNTATIAFTNPPAINVASSFTNASCNGNCNGAISITASGGTGALTYSWSPGGQTTANVTNLCAGTYTVNIRDANNCTETRTFVITEPSAITATFTPTNPTTCSGTNGSITSNVSGGTPAYQYTWTPGGATTSSITNIGAGTYTLLIRDNAGCTQTLVTTLSDPTGPTLTVTSASIACNGSCTGAATVSASGTGAITYTWSNGSNATSVSGLCTGTFAVNVEDATSCITSQTISITQPPTFSLNPVVSNVGCNAACNGSITTTPAGGTPGYTVTWSPGSVVSNTLTGACAGTYTANIIDANNCPVSQTFTITQPNAITLAFTKSNVLCNAACNGTAAVIPSGGTAPFTYSWSPVGTFTGSTLSFISGLCPNIYTVTVRDANNCVTTGTVQITEPAALTGTLNFTNALCNSQCNGSATLTVSGGTPTYTFSWSGSTSTTNIASSLCAGNYSGTVTDANGCVFTQSFAVTQPSAITVTLNSVNPLCNNQCNGSITVNASGGTPAYTYSWLPTGSGSASSGLCAGSYTVFVRDVNNCLGQNITTLTNPLALLANATFTNPSCNSNCNGTAISNPANGTGPFSYTWTTLPVQTTQSATSMCAGTYSVYVSDSNGCKDTQQVVLISPPSLTINPSTSAATCGTLCNGSINLVPSGGTPAYTFTWSPSVSTGSVASNICAGIYTVIVKDANNCATTFQIPLSNSNGPSGAVVTTTNVNCNGQCTGAASVTNPVGGTAPYVITWVTPSSTLNPVTSLCAGLYTAQITDANNCIYFQPVSITAPPALIVNPTINLPLCAGVCNGSISVNPSGGSPAYTYSWSTGATTSSITNICPGNYTLNITDTKTCVTTQTFNIPGTVNITSTPVSVNNSCFGICNGSILASAVSGGIGPYTFSWSDPLGQNAQQAINLCNGVYSVTIFDTQGCSNTFTGNVTSPAAITMTSSVAQPSCGLCNGSATVTAIGGTSPFTYTWSNSAVGVSSSSLCAGVYMVTITDNNGCVQNVNLPINNSSGITGETISVTNETCFNQCNGSVTVTAVGGTAPITYNWISPSATTNTLGGLCGGTYIVQMQDAQGCIRNASVSVTSASSLTVTQAVVQPSCTLNNGSITVNVSGGTPGYTYNWVPAAPNSATLSNIGPGNYSLTIVDNAGCSQSLSFPISNQNGPTLSASSVSATCNGSCNAAATVSVTSGVAPYTFTWSAGTAVNSSTTSTTSGLCSGLVTVTVTASNGCKSVQSINISQPSAVVPGLPIISNPKCNNDCNGSISLIPSGGSLPYTFTWSPSGSSNPLTGLCAGSYSVTITDNKGCNISASYTLSNPPYLALGATITNASCNTALDGAITTTVSGGIPAYTYSWTGPGAFTGTASGISNVLSGTYSLSLTDAGGCRRDTTMIIASTLTVLAVAGPDSSFCQSSSFVLNGTNSVGGVTYQWFQVPNAVSFSSSLTTTVNPSIGTSTFVLVATNGTCVHRDTVLITSNSLPIVDAGPNYTITVLTTTIIGGSPTGPAGSTFTWTPSSTLDNSNIANPVASNTVNTTYTVTVTDANGCVASDTMHVFIYPAVVIPNGFSPNSDGKNDVWEIDNIIQFPDCVVEVYNRWGEQLFYSKGYGVPWNGKYKGKDLPVGTYYYIINLNHQNFPKAYTGPLTIFR